MRATHLWLKGWEKDECERWDGKSAVVLSTLHWMVPVSCAELMRSSVYLSIHEHHRFYLLIHCLFFFSPLYRAEPGEKSKCLLFSTRLSKYRWTKRLRLRIHLPYHSKEPQLSSTEPLDFPCLLICNTRDTKSDIYLYTGDRVICEVSQYVKGRTRRILNDIWRLMANFVMGYSGNRRTSRHKAFGIRVEWSSRAGQQ